MAEDNQDDLLEEETPSSEDNLLEEETSAPAKSSKNDAEDEDASSDSPKKNWNKKKLLIIAGAATALLLIVVLILYLFVFSSDDDMAPEEMSSDIEAIDENVTDVDMLPESSDSPAMNEMASNQEDVIELPMVNDESESASVAPPIESTEEAPMKSDRLSAISGAMKENSAFSGGNTQTDAIELPFDDPMLTPDNDASAAMQAEIEALKAEFARLKDVNKKLSQNLDDMYKENNMLKSTIGMSDMAPTASEAIESNPFVNSGYGSYSYDGSDPYQHTPKYEIAPIWGEFDSNAPEVQERAKKK
jgi:HAMP domain-containing protein